MVGWVSGAKGLDNVSESSTRKRTERAIMASTSHDNRLLGFREIPVSFREAKPAAFLQIHRYKSGHYDFSSAEA